MNVLAIGAHPDDVEFGCGGTLLAHARRGDRVHLYVLTHGEQGGDAGVRHEEAKAAAELLGARTLTFGPYCDTEVPCSRDSIADIGRTLAVFPADTIYVHYPDDAHQDHRHAAEATIAAARRTRQLLFYEGVSTRSFTPTLFTDLEGVLEGKLAALRAHASQLARTYTPHGDIVDIAASTAAFRGVQARVPHAEGFVAGRYLLDFP